VGSSASASDDLDLTGRTLFGMLVERGGPITLVASWYQLIVVFALTPAVAWCTSLAVTNTGGPAVVNAAMARILVSPVSLGALAVGQLVAIAGSSLLAGACGIVALEGVLNPLVAIWRSVRRLPRLIAIVLWGLLGALLLSLAPLGAAVGVYAYRWGTQQTPAEVFESDPSALIALGAVLGVVLAALWTYLFLRWLFAIPVSIAENISARKALGRSWKLTKYRWFSVGFRVARAQLMFAIVGGLVLATVGFAALGVADKGVSPALAGVIALYSVCAVALNVALSVSFESIRLSAFLAVSKGALPEGVGSAGGWMRWVPVVLVCGAAAATGLLGVAGVAQDLEKPVDYSRIEVIAHRAGARHAPENSLAAVARAEKDGASRIEFDVRWTADGQLVVVHDKKLRRVAGKDVEVAKSKFADIGLIDIGRKHATQFAGEGVPPLDQFLEATGDTPLALEIKNGKGAREATRKIVALLRERGDVDRTVVLCLEPKLTKYAHSLDPTLKTGDLISVSEGRSYLLAADVIAPQYALVNSQYISDVHARGKRVWVWTVDDEDDIREAALRGVDGIITSDVPKARGVLESLSTHPPTVAEVTRQRVGDLIGE
jgi:glycerophosphoryl diester phosphodiesterase